MSTCRTGRRSSSIRRPICASRRSRTASRRVDAILFTHSHADHIMGLDDVRRFNVMQSGAIPAYADERTGTDLRRAFSYVFNPPSEQGGGVPQISLTTIDGPFNVGGIGIQPVPIFHGSRPILGFRFGNFAYLTDCSRLADDAWPLLEGVDVLILDALRHRPHPTHFTVAEALQVAERVKPRLTYFTHVCHDLPHAATNASLPRGVELAYDGLALTIETAPAFAEAPPPPRLRRTSRLPSARTTSGRNPFSRGSASRHVAIAGARARQLRRPAPRPRQDHRAHSTRRPRTRRHERGVDVRSAPAAHPAGPTRRRRC